MKQQSRDHALQVSRHVEVVVVEVREDGAASLASQPVALRAERDHASDEV